MKILNVPFLLIVTMISGLYSCSSPGILTPSSNTSFSGETIFRSGNEILDVIEIDQSNAEQHNQNFRSYIVAPGDQLNFTVWGLPDAFPSLGFTIRDNPLNTRTVNSDGTIFFPFIGRLTVAGLSITDTRELITKKLQEEFINPQVDVTVVEFNEKRNVYVVGEILSPVTFKVALEPVSLMDAIGRARGLNPNTSNGSEIFIMRSLNDDPKIFRIDLSTSDKFLLANKFYVEPQDVIFVGPSDITKWNRVVSQLFPFSSLLNQLDLIATRNSNN